jgi:hypothetical protein
MLTIAADPKHLGARIGITAVLRRTCAQPRCPYPLPLLRAGNYLMIDDPRDNVRQFIA